MIKKNVLLSFLAFSLMVTPMVVFAASPSPGNIEAAYVNMDRVLQSDSSYQQAIKDLEDYRNDLRNRIENQRKELRKMQKNLKQEGSLLSKKQRKQKQRQMQQKLRSLQQRAQQSKAQLQKKKQELLAPVLEKIDPVVRSVAEEEGYNVIYSYGQQNNPSVLWVDDSINITQKIIDRLEAQS